MKKRLQKRIMENFDKKNVENVSELIEEPMSEMVGMFINESGNGEEVKISVESRKDCVKALLR